MHSLEYIDGYFKGDFSPKEKTEFEKKLAEDPNFADDVAFYISTRQVSKDLVIEEKKNNFKRIYAEYNKEARVIPMRRIWSYSAAAAVFAALVFSWFMFMKPPTAQQMAEHYIKSNLSQLSVDMGGKQDSLQTGLRLFNNNKLNESLAIFETMATRDSSDVQALKNAGIVLLRQKQYDSAIDYFNRLEKLNLRANPGIFLHALTLMLRGSDSDLRQAKTLLEEVVDQNLEGKESASRFLKNL